MKTTVHRALTLLPRVKINVVSQSCSSGQKLSKGNTCLDTDWFLFIVAVIKWLRHPHYPEMKLKDPGRTLPSVWLLWGVCISREHITQFTPKTIRQRRSKGQLSVTDFSVLLVNQLTSIGRRKSDFLSPTCCFEIGNLLLHCSAANHNTQCSQTWSIINHFVKGLRSRHLSENQGERLAFHSSKLPSHSWVASTAQR